MTSPARTAIAYSIILAAVVGLGGFAWHQARTAEAARLAVVRKRAALAAGIRELEATIAAQQAADKREALRRQSPWRVSVGDSGAAGDVGRKTALPPNSKALSLLSAAYRALLPQRYGTLYRTLGLAPAQIAAFESLFSMHRDGLIDLRIVAAQDGLDDSGPEIAAIRREENDNFRAELKALLGPSGYQQMQEANRIVPMQDFVNGLELGTGFPPETLTAAQTRQLSLVLARASNSYQNGGAADPATVDWDAVFPQVRTILSVSQMEGLRASIDQIQLDQLRKQFFQREQGTKVQ